MYRASAAPIRNQVRGDTPWTRRFLEFASSTSLSRLHQSFAPVRRLDKWPSVARLAGNSSDGNPDKIPWMDTLYRVGTPSSSRALPFHDGNLIGHASGGRDRFEPLRALQGVRKRSIVRESLFGRGRGVFQPESASVMREPHGDMQRWLGFTKGKTLSDLNSNLSSRRGGKRPAIQAFSRRLSHNRVVPGASRKRCMKTRSSQRPNLCPTSLKWATCSNPRRS